VVSGREITDKGLMDHFDIPALLSVRVTTLYLAGSACLQQPIGFVAGNKGRKPPLSMAVYA